MTTISLISCAGARSPPHCSPQRKRVCYLYLTNTPVGKGPGGRERGSRGYFLLLGPRLAHSKNCSPQGSRDVKVPEHMDQGRVKSGSKLTAMRGSHTCGSSGRGPFHLGSLGHFFFFFFSLGHFTSLTRPHGSIFPAATCPLVLGGLCSLNYLPRDAPAHPWAPLMPNQGTFRCGHSCPLPPFKSAPQ